MKKVTLANGEQAICDGCNALLTDDEIVFELDGPECFCLCAGCYDEGQKEAQKWLHENPAKEA